MRKLPNLFVFSSLLISSACFSQNLVPNPSFEDTVSCPDYISQINRATGWISYRNTPDLYHKCSNSIYVTIPSNEFGFQYPSSNDCSSYAGIYTYGLTGANWREFIGRELPVPLQIGEKYYVSMKVSLAENEQIASNGLGLRFSTSSYNSTNPVPIDNFAHIYSNSIIADTASWASVTGSYVADSAYNYVAIGNFFNDANTDTVLFNNSGTNGAYYFIDDVCISTDSLFCNSFSPGCNNVFINESSIDKQDVVFYSKVTKSILIKSNNNKSKEIILYNLLGEKIKSMEMKKNYVEFDVENLITGIFILTLENNSNFNSHLIFINNF